MKDIFEKINIFTHSLSLNHDKKFKFHSLYGYSFSLIFYLVFSYCIYYFSYDFINSTNPKINFKQAPIINKTKYLGEIINETKSFIDILIISDFQNLTSELPLYKIFETQIHFIIKKETNFSYSYFSSNCNSSHIYPIPKQRYNEIKYKNFPDRENKFIDKFSLKCFLNDQRQFIKKNESRKITIEEIAFNPVMDK